MSRELIYLLLICGLLIVPRALQRFRIPAPLSCFLIGVALVLFRGPQHNDAIHLLSSLGISSLFLHAGMEVDIAALRRGARPLVAYLVIRIAMLVLAGWVAVALLDLQWQAAALLALALLTSSTGFIVDSLDRFLMRPEDRFWVTNKAISGELLALALMFLVLKGGDGMELAGSSFALIALAVAVPLLYLALGRWISPHAPGSEFSLLVMVGLAAAYVTHALGVEYLLGAFVAGLVARQLQSRLPALASEHNLHAVKLFASFFMPFYFFGHGAKVPTGALTWEALFVGLALTAVVLPLRFGSIWAQRRWMFRDGFGSSLRVATSLMPTLIFTLVLATILRETYHIPDALYGGLLLYAFLNTLLPSLVLHTAFDVAPPPGAARAQHPVEAGPAAEKA